MINNTLATDLPVVEVPLELRGLPDEEIIRLSESRQKKFENPPRPSKRERQEKKLLLAQAEMQKISKEFAHDESHEVKFDTNNSFKDLFARKFDEPTALAKESVRPADVVVRSSITAAPKPASGRVLSGKFTFGKKIGMTATVVNAADLEKERAAERAKKIQEQSAPKAVRAQKAPTPIQYDADGNPIKRKRGRPRKNPLPEVSENM